MKRERNYYRIPRPILPMVLTRLNLAAVCASMGVSDFIGGNLERDIEALVRLAKKQTIAAGKHKIQPVEKEMKDGLGKI